MVAPTPAYMLALERPHFFGRLVAPSVGIIVTCAFRSQKISPCRHSIVGNKSHNGFVHKTGIIEFCITKVLVLVLLPLLLLLRLGQTYGSAASLIQSVKCLIFLSYSCSCSCKAYLAFCSK